LLRVGPRGASGTLVSDPVRASPTQRPRPTSLQACQEALCSLAKSANAGELGERGHQAVLEVWVERGRGELLSGLSQVSEDLGPLCRE